MFPSIRANFFAFFGKSCYKWLQPYRKNAVEMVIHMQMYKV